MHNYSVDPFIVRTHHRPSPRANRAVYGWLSPKRNVHISMEVVVHIPEPPEPLRWLLKIVVTLLFEDIPKLLLHFNSSASNHYSFYLLPYVNRISCVLSSPLGLEHHHHPPGIFPVLASSKISSQIATKQPRPIF